MIFEKDYFKDSVLSNYRDYRKKKYDALFEDLLRLGIVQGDSIVEFGCATGALIYEFVNHGYTNIVGTDVSWWAITYGRNELGIPDTKLQYLNYNLLASLSDWLLCLDVLEHIGTDELKHIIDIMCARRLVLRVPVCAREGQDFVLDVSKNDKTHIQCHTKLWWKELLSRRYTFDRPIAGNAIYDSEGVFAGVFNVIS